MKIVLKTCTALGLLLAIGGAGGLSDGRATWAEWFILSVLGLAVAVVSYKLEGWLYNADHRSTAQSKAELPRKGENRMYGSVPDRTGHFTPAGKPGRTNSNIY